MLRRAINFAKIHQFGPRHIGINQSEQEHMLKQLNCNSLEELTKKAMPGSIRTENPLLKSPLTENEATEYFDKMLSKNKIYKSYIGMGYHNTNTPAVIKRNLLENPMWYTQYTPYQPEISQGRLESLFNFQTLISELTGLEISNASLLDEPTAAAEAMQMMYAITSKSTLIVDKNIHPHTLEMLYSRASPLNITIVVSSDLEADIASCDDFMGTILQYPDTFGVVKDFSKVIKLAHDKKGLATMCCDLLSLFLIKSPGDYEADITVGNSQRFGVPLGYGGPHAAFFATKKQYIRKMPGRIVGQTIDADGSKCYRLTLQTREQHIKRDKATSNICTAQALLANMASMFVVYHGKSGCLDLATVIHNRAVQLQGSISSKYKVLPGAIFDTISFYCKDISSIVESSESHSVNFRYTKVEMDKWICTIALDETTSVNDLKVICSILQVPLQSNSQADSLMLVNFKRSSNYLSQPIFKPKSETEMLRYLYKLQKMDLSLADSMIPLGSCTMKLNATSEMLPISNPNVNQLHPFVPQNQTLGYQDLFTELQADLCSITGMSHCNLQPNSGAQGEYAGLRCIKSYFDSKKSNRNIVLIPTSAHGTNPASAIMTGYKVVPIQCVDGELSKEDLKNQLEKHGEKIAAIMITYPSTFGVFDESIKEICDLVHNVGAQVYLDGANMNAQVGLCKPGEYGADVIHLNLHKTFCIPHGGGGPGVGAICVQSHLKPFCPQHQTISNIQSTPSKTSSIVSGAPYGSASILPITYMYIKMMGGAGLTKSSQVAILNANYMANQLKKDYKVLYTNKNGYCAHEFIIDARHFENDITGTDVAKRLLDYGFHAPTMSWPIVNTLMIEPTESEPFSELERFINAMRQIRKEIKEKPALLKNAPHTMEMVVKKWSMDYTREEAVYPDGNIRKFWPTVRRVDDKYGDKNIVCACPPMADYE